MTFVFSPTPDNRLLRETGAPDLPATLGETLSAAFSDPTASPTELLSRQAEIVSEGGRIRSFQDVLAENRARRGPLSPREAERIARTGEEPDPGEETLPEVGVRTLDVLTTDEANERFGHLGLKFDRPIPRRSAELMAEGKREEMIRKDILARGPSGVLPTAARFGASFAAAATDPLNIASAFIPVVSQARFAGFVGRMGITRARLLAGTIEGAVGNALIEPGVFLLAKEQQLDYTMADALLNVGLGGLLGGGLHVAVGRMGDFLSRQSPEVREVMLRGSIAHAATGNRIGIDPMARFDVLNPDRVFATAPEARGFAPEARSFDLGPSTGRGRGEKFQAYTPVREGDKPFLEGLVAELRQTDSGHRIFLEAEGQGGTPDVIGVQASTPRWFQDHNIAVAAERKHIRQIKKANEKLPAEQQVPVPATPEILTRKRVEAVAEKMLAHKPLGRAEAEVARVLFETAREQRVRNAGQMLEHRRARDLEREAEIDAIAAREMADAGDPERDLTADFAASERAAAVVREEPALQTDIEFLAEQVENLRQSGVIGERESAEIARADDLVEAAESYARAARAAALCLSR